MQARKIFFTRICYEELNLCYEELNHKKIICDALLIIIFTQQNINPESFVHSTFYD